MISASNIIAFEKPYLGLRYLFRYYSSQGHIATLIITISKNGYLRQLWGEQVVIETVSIKERSLPSAATRALKRDGTMFSDIERL